MVCAGRNDDMLVPNKDASWVGTGNFEELRATLHREGFLSLDNVTDADDIQSIREDILGLLADRGGGLLRFNDLGDASSDSNEPSILEVIAPSAFRPRLLESLFINRALEISRAILGSSAQFRFDHCIAKPPYNEAATVWHQDCAYQRFDQRIRLSHQLHWWLPLQDVTVENGCMYFVPGSHLGPVLAHTPRSAGAHALQANLPDDAVTVACPLRVGGATIHLPKTLHYTSANNSNAARLAWIVQFGVSGWVSWIRR
jgi:ectoine hydroxylase-related dioxygenase (phytanoyl-CoA dioxygenase family)